MLSVSLYALDRAITRTREPESRRPSSISCSPASSAAFLLFGMALVYAELGTLEFARMASDRASDAPGPVWLSSASGCHRRLRLQAGARAVPPVDAGCVPGRAGSGHGVRRDRLEGRRCSPCFALFHRSSTCVPITRCSLIFAMLAIGRWWSATSSRCYRATSNACSPTRRSPTSAISLVAFLASGALAATAITFYLVAYFVTTIGAFGVVTVLSSAAARQRTWTSIEVSLRAARG